MIVCTFHEDIEFVYLAFITEYWYLKIAWLIRETLNEKRDDQTCYINLIQISALLLPSCVAFVKSLNCHKLLNVHFVHKEMFCSIVLALR